MVDGVRIAVASLLLSAVLAGCNGPSPVQTQEDPEDIPLPQRLDWTRSGSVQVPEMHIGDVYRVQYDIENIGNAIATETWRVRAPPGDFIDRTGASFRPPAVLELWNPGSGDGWFLVLDQAGRVMAQLSIRGTSSEDLLAKAWAAGEILYGPYGLGESRDRLFLLVGLAGQDHLATELTSWEAYLTTYELYARQESGRTTLGAIGFVHNGGNWGAYDRPPVALAADYEFTDAPIPSKIRARHNLYGDKLDEEGLLARLTGWEPGMGPAVMFVNGTSRFALAENRVAPGEWLPAERMPVKLTYEDATSFLQQNATFREWTQAHPDFRMTDAFYDDFWVESADEKARPKWWLQFETADAQRLATRVSLHSEPLPLVGLPPGVAGPATLRIDYFRPGQSLAANWSHVPDLLPLDRVLSTARSWAVGKDILDQASIHASATSSWGYRFPPDWPRDVWFGGATSCFTFRAPGADQRFGVTNVHMDLTTGWMQHVDRDADASHCN